MKKHKSQARYDGYRQPNNLKGSKRNNQTHQKIGDRVLNMPLFDPQKRKENHYGRNWTILGAAVLWLTLSVGPVLHDVKVATNEVINVSKSKLGISGPDPLNKNTHLRYVTVGQSPNIAILNGASPYSKSTYNATYTPLSILEANYPPEVLDNSTDKYYLLNDVESQEENGVLQAGQEIKLPTRFDNGQEIPMKQNNN